MTLRAQCHRWKGLLESEHVWKAMIEKDMQNRDEPWRKCLLLPRLISVFFLGERRCLHMQHPRRVLLGPCPGTTSSLQSCIYLSRCTCSKRLSSTTCHIQASHSYHMSHKFKPATPPPARRLTACLASDKIFFFDVETKTPGIHPCFISSSPCIPKLYGHDDGGSPSFSPPIVHPFLHLVDVMLSSRLSSQLVLFRWFRAPYLSFGHMHTEFCEDCFHIYIHMQHMHTCSFHLGGSSRVHKSLEDVSDNQTLLGSGM